MKLKSMLVCCLMLIPILSGCAGGNGTKETGAGPQQAGVPGNAGAQNTQTETVPVTEPPAIPVTTPYGTLYYQAQWEGVMKTEQEQTDSGLCVSFSTELDGTEYPLFTVTIGADESNAGHLTGGDGTERNVFVALGELGDLSALTEEQKNYLYAIQEDINFVIQKINEKEQ